MDEPCTLTIFLKLLLPAYPDSHLGGQRCDGANSLRGTDALNARVLSWLGFPA